MSNRYGFKTETYDNGLAIETLVTGDGKTQFAECIFDDGTVSLAVSYDNGVGSGIVGEKTTIGRNMDDEMAIHWQIKFESPGSIDSLIETLLRAKLALVSQTDAPTHEWDDPDGSTCGKCGDKDWMADAACSESRIKKD